MFDRRFHGIGIGLAVFCGLIFLVVIIEWLAGPIISPGPGRTVMFVAFMLTALAVTGVMHRRQWPQKQAEVVDPVAEEMFRRVLEVSQAWRNPPTTEEGSPELKTLQRAAAQCLALRHVFPPRHPPHTLCALGGLPVAPADFDYPVVQEPNGEIVGLSFMAQIDCATLPPGPARDLLPASGHLYFFAPQFSDFSDSPYQNCVRYVPSSAGLDWAPREPGPPAVLKPLEDAEFSQRWTYWHPQPKQLHPCVSPRIEIELGWVAHLPPKLEDGPGLALVAEHGREGLLSFHGIPVPHNPILNGWNDGAELPFPPYEGFPTNRYAAEILVGHLRVLLRDEVAQAAKLAGGPKPLADDAIERLNAAVGEREKLQADLAALDLAQTLPSERGAPLSMMEKSEVLAQLHRVLMQAPVSAATSEPANGFNPGHEERRRRQKLQEFVAQAAAHSAELALRDPSTAHLIPPSYTEALRFNHTPLTAERFGEHGHYHQHQMLGVGRDIQGSVGYLGQSQIMLMQLSPDKGLDWHFGDVGVLQYWIAPADLAALRFDRVVATFECH